MVVVDGGLGDVVVWIGLGRLMGVAVVLVLEIEVEVAAFGWEGIFAVLCCDVA